VLELIFLNPRKSASPRVSSNINLTAKRGTREIIQVTIELIKDQSPSFFGVSLILQGTCDGQVILPYGSERPRRSRRMPREPLSRAQFEGEVEVKGNFTIIDGRVYDLSPGFLQWHPGGAVAATQVGTLHR
jgi:cytochrome b involved in lipid metabolism